MEQWRDYVAEQVLATDLEVTALESAGDQADGASKSVATSRWLAGFVAHDVTIDGQPARCDLAPSSAKPRRRAFLLQDPWMASRTRLAAALLGQRVQYVHHEVADFRQPSLSIDTPTIQPVSSRLQDRNSASARALGTKSPP